MKHITLFAAALLVTACAVTPAQQAQINGLVATVGPLVQTYAQTGHINEAQAIPAALNSLAVFEPSEAVDATQLATRIENAVSAYTNNTGATTGQKIASAVLSALPPNPNGAQVNAALAQASIGAGNGASN